MKKTLGEDVIMQELYGETYYKCHCGPNPYERNDAWLQFFGNISHEIVRSLAPKTVFDAGCAWGFLVEAFWDRGIEAKGIDISEYAIGQVRRDIKQFCHVGSLTSSIDEKYDLITCIEVLEHMPSDEAEIAIANLCQATDTILFSSSPTDLTEETHFNVNPTIVWLKIFSKHGFFPDLVYDASFLVAHAILFRRQNAPIIDTVPILFSEKIRLRIALADQGGQIEVLKASAKRVCELENQLIAFSQEKQLKEAELNSSADRVATLESEVGALGGEVKILEDQIKACMQENQRKEIEIHVARSENEHARMDTFKLQEENAQLRGNVSRMTAELNTVQLQSKHFDLTASHLRAELSRLENLLIKSIAKFTDLEATKSRDASGPIRQTSLIKSLLARVKGKSYPSLSSSMLVDANSERNWQREAALVVDSGLFDSDWYLDTNRDVASAGIEPVEHYLMFGAEEGRDPSPQFSTCAYLDRNPEVREAKLNPLVHYIKHGATNALLISGTRSDAQGNVQSRGLDREVAMIASSDLFDAQWYLQNNEDVAQAGVDPILHYLLNGGAEGRDPSPRFSTLAYLDRYPEVRQARLNPLVHYIKHGVQNPLLILGTGSDAQEFVQTHGLDREVAMIASSDLFDAEWYLRNNEDVAQAGVDPILHYLLNGGAEGRDPGPRFSTLAYLARYPEVSEAGLNPLVHYIEHGRVAGLIILGPSQERTARVILDEKFPALKPLPVFHLSFGPARVVMVTDSVNAGSLYGGVGTALILTALLASRLNWQMCIVTRTELADQDNVGRVLRVHDIQFTGNIEFIFVPPNGNTMLPISDDDLFITTSWWTTHSVAKSVASSQIIYLIQEDERMFYPYGDDHLLCVEQLSSRDIKYIVNSEFLFNHFKNSSLSNICDCGTFFEPCFPLNEYYSINQPRAKLNFMFYARPNNARNLFYRGIEVINSAIERRILAPEEWNFSFVGKDLKPLSLASGVTPTLHQNMEWSSYTTLVRETDLALSLMYTPHPSYPPLDVVASGGVAVTNKFANKESLNRYSDNLLCTEHDVESLLRGIEEGVRLAKNVVARQANYRMQKVQRDWKSALAPSIDFIVKV